MQAYSPYAVVQLDISFEHGTSLEDAKQAIDGVQDYRFVSSCEVVKSHSALDLCQSTAIQRTKVSASNCLSVTL